ncbi:MAG: zinc ribbon domain-containing protein, partial [Zoogloeaceae bacterium]|nr:zinc ribbon domain-containing protein [Zoogloeaceae bacterium]
MFCAHCRSLLPAGAKFCKSCGKAVATTHTCPRCHAALPADAKFCKACGAHLTAQEEIAKAPAPEHPPLQGGNLPEKIAEASAPEPLVAEPPARAAAAPAPSAPLVAPPSASPIAPPVAPAAPKTGGKKRLVFV